MKARANVILVHLQLLNHYWYDIGPEYNCRLYHLDHWTLPDGPSTFLVNDRPLIDNGGRIGNYFENRCKSKYHLLGTEILLLIYIYS